jgi:type I restriction enzyme S subunit
MEMKPYPAYTDTDLPWLPKIPKHWEVKRLKQVADVTFSSVDKHSKEDEQPVLLCNYVDVYKNEHITRDLEFMQATASSDEIKRFTLREGDVMITKDSESWNDIAVPAYVSEDLDNVLCGYHLALLRPRLREMDGGFLFRALQARPMSYQFEVEATGITRYGIDQYAISSTFFPVPPLPEQRTIATYLDRQTAKIDALIAKKQRLLDLLAEQRAALISQAVTKGLNPAVEMKDSGVAWLGQVPSHWKVNLVKRHFDIDLGKMLDSSKQPENGFLKPYLRAANIYWEGAWVDDVKEMKFTKEQLKRYRLQKGDLLVTEGGATVGRSAIWQGELEEVYYQNSINRARPKGTLPVKFLYYWLYALKLTGFIDNVISKATFGHLTKDKLQLLQMTVPPKQEAEEIAKHIDIKLAYYARIENKINDVIARLQEYRAALISSVVTGKVQVK